MNTEIDGAEDNLAAARGIIFAGALSVVMWAAIILGLFWGLSAFAGSVTSYQVISNELQGSSRVVKYEYEMLDNNSVTSFFVLGPRIVPAATDLNADMAAQASVVLQIHVNGEIDSSINDAVNGAGDGDPLHIFTTFWEKDTPNWNTWDDLFLKLSAYFWSQEYQLDILPFADAWGRVSSTDKKNILVITQTNVSDMNADMQIAADTAASLSSYLPYLDDEGNWIHP